MCTRFGTKDSSLLTLLPGIPNPDMRIHFAAGTFETRALAPFLPPAPHQLAVRKHVLSHTHRITGASTSAVLALICIITIFFAQGACVMSRILHGEANLGLATKILWPSTA